MRHGVTRKRSTKRVKHTGNLFRKKLQLEISVNSRLKAIQIMEHRKNYYRERIPESSCARNETAEIDILLTSRNGILLGAPAQKWQQYSIDGRTVDV